LQDVAIERQIGHHALQPRVLLLEHAQLAQLRHAEPGKLLLPHVERRLGHPELPAHVTGRGSRFGLAQRVGDLLFREAGLLHAPLLVVKGASAATLL